MRTLFLFFAMAVALPVVGQEVNANRLTVGVGSAVPAGKLSNVDAGTAMELNFGYRYTRYLQVDVGVEASFNKDYRDYYAKYNTGLATSPNLFAPVGGRIAIPILNGRIEPGFGLGGVYAYDKGISGVTFKHHQGGIYGLAGASYALDSQHRHRVGVTVRYINILSVGNPHPQWINVFGEYTFSWGE